VNRNLSEAPWLVVRFVVCLAIVVGFITPSWRPLPTALAAGQGLDGLILLDRRGDTLLGWSETNFGLYLIGPDGERRAMSVTAFSAQFIGDTDVLYVDRDLALKRIGPGGAETLLPAGQANGPVFVNPDGQTVAYLKPLDFEGGTTPYTNGVAVLDLVTGIETLLFQLPRVTVHLYGWLGQSLVVEVPNWTQDTLEPDPTMHLGLLSTTGLQTQITAYSDLPASRSGSPYPYTSPLQTHLAYEAAEGVVVVSLNNRSYTVLAGGSRPRWTSQGLSILRQTHEETIALGGLDWTMTTPLNPKVPLPSVAPAAFGTESIAPNLAGLADGPLATTLLYRPVPSSTPVSAYYDLDRACGALRDWLGNIWTVACGNSGWVYGRTYDNHEGTDYDGADGDPIYAAQTGVVGAIALECNNTYPTSSYGTNFRIEHGTLSDGNAYSTGYAHLRCTDLGVTQGTTISALPRQVALMGNTGNSTGAHLHLNARRNNALFDPYEAGIMSDSPSGGTNCPAPTLNGPADGYISNSQTLTFSWTGPSGCTYSGYTFRIKDTANMETGGSQILDTGEGNTSRTVTVSAEWNNRDLYWGVRTANPQSPNWAVRRFRIEPSSQGSGNWSVNYYDTVDRWWDNNNSGNYRCNETITGPMLDVNYGTGTRCGMDPDSWVAEYQATVNVPSGNYAFYVEHDDGLKVWLNNNNIADRGGSGSDWICPARAMGSGTQLKVMLREDGGDARVKVIWTADTTVCNSVATPSGLSATAVSPNAINLTWSDNASDETNYRVERSLDGSSWAEIATIGAGSTSYGSVGLTANTRYYYRVRAYRSHGNRYSEFSAIASATTLLDLAAPSGLTATAVSGTQINLGWTDNSTDESYFRVERSPNGTTGWAEIGTALAGITSFTNNGLTPGTTYYFRVQAYRGIDAAVSGYSSTASATTIVGDTQSPNVSWTQPVADNGSVTVISNTLTLGVTATDNVGVSSVTFTRWDAANLVVVELGVDTTAPYQLAIDTRLLNYGPNQVNAFAKDAAGNVSTSPHIWAQRNYPAQCQDCNLAASAWPAFRHDLQHTGRGEATGPAVPTLKWSFSSGATTSSTPSIGADGAIYVGLGSSLYAFNSDGTTRWTYLTGGNVKTPLVGADGTVYFGSSDGKVYALNTNGTLKWSFTTGSWIEASPTLAPDGTIYIGSSDTYFYALNSNGTQRWRRLIGSWINSTPALDGGEAMYFGSTNHSVYALNHDGSVRWSFPTGSFVDSSPALAPDGSIFIGSIDGKLYALTNNGALKWSYTTGGPVYSSPALGNDGAIYFSSEDTKLYSLNADGTLRWSYTTQGAANGSPIIGENGITYWRTDDGGLYAISGTGALVWRFVLGGSSTGAVMGADGTLYTTSGGALSAVGQSSSILAPSGLGASAVSTTQINLSWTDNSSDETNFRIERSANGTSGWTEIGTAAANATTYSNTGLTAGTTYYYRVRGYRSSDASYSAYTSNASATTPLVALAAPSGLGASAVSTTQINLSWTDNSSDETNFRIERSANGTSGWTEVGTAAANATTYSNTGLTAGTTYYYRVRGYRSSDASYSAYTSNASATTPTGSGVTLALSPVSSTVAVGQTFDLVVQVQAGSQLVDGASAYLSFDPAVLQVVSLTGGTALPSELQKQYNNTAGTVDYAAGALSSFPSGTITVVTITFRANATSAGAQVNFDTAMPRRSDVTYGGASIVGTRQGATVVVSNTASLVGTVGLQGRSAKPAAAWSVPVTATLTLAGQNTPAYSFSLTTDMQGVFTATAISPGTYTLRVKNAHTLQSVQTVTLQAGANAVAIGTLREGDANGDNYVTLVDFSVLASTYGKGSGTSGYDDRADFNEDQYVTLLDFSLLASNYGQVGATVVRKSQDTTQVEGAGTVDLRIDPLTSLADVGDVITVTVRVEAGAQVVDGAQASLDFDPSQLRVRSVSGNTGVLPLVLQSAYDNGAGTIDYAGATLSTAPSGSFTLVTIAFDVIGTDGLRTLSFHHGVPRDTDVTSGGASVLGAARDGHVFVGADERVYLPILIR